MGMGLKVNQQALVFILIYTAYCGYYFNRKNYSFWLDAIIETTTITKASAGLIGSCFEISSGIAKIVLAVFVDTHNPRIVLAGGLLISTISNLFIVAAALLLRTGSSLQLFAYIVSWGINGIAQAVGWPALARIFLTWFPDPAKRGFWYSLLSTNQNMGGAVVPVMLVPAIAHFGWLAALVVPSVVSFVISVLVFVLIKDEPDDDDNLDTYEALGSGERASGSGSGSGSVGSASPFAPIEPYKPEQETLTRIIVDDVIKNPSIWLLGISYFFISYARNGLGDWGLKLLSETWGLDKTEASSCLFLLEMGGFAGGLLGGLCSDKIFHGKRGPVIGGASFLTVLPIITLSTVIPSYRHIIPQLSYFLFGLFSFTPHVLIGLTAREYSRTAAQSTAGGFAKFLGQCGGAMAGAPFGSLVDTFGWGYGMQATAVSAFLSGVAMLPLWQTPALREKRTKNK